jgi:hypothetical protein
MKFGHRSSNVFTSPNTYIYVEDILEEIFVTNEPPGPVTHDLGIGYPKCVAGLGGGSEQKESFAWKQHTVIARYPA